MLIGFELFCDVVAGASATLTKVSGLKMWALVAYYTSDMKC